MSRPCLGRIPAVSRSIGAARRGSLRGSTGHERGSTMVARAVRIAVIPGDGIGTEVIDAAIEVTDRALAVVGTRLEWTRFPWGSNYFHQHGRMLPPDGIEQLKSFDSILLGAVGHPSIQDHTTLDGLLLPIRRRFDQYACVRPA